MTNLLIGTSNQYKVGFYRDMLTSDVDVTTPHEQGIKIDIDEDLYDIVGNSQKKALAFAKAADMLALSDDSGIFIPALNNEPGVAARRWGGELPDTTSDEEWIEHFLYKTTDLADDQRTVNRRQVITLATPAGAVETLDMATTGTLLRERAQPTYPAGGPFAVFFSVDEFGKAEIDLNHDEKALFTARIKAGVMHALNNLTNL